MAELVEQKKCMQVVGGRLDTRQLYAMPRLQMSIDSRLSPHGLHGGGEVHYVSSCASGRITRLLLADISGSETVFKQLAGKLQSGLIRNINSVRHDRVVQSMTDQFQQFARVGGFATAAVATFFATTRRFVMCNIGNPPPLVYRAESQEWEVLHGDHADSLEDEGCQDGVFAESEYRQISTTLKNGDLVLIYGNGVANSTFPSGNVVGHVSMRNALQDSSHASPEARLRHLGQILLDKNSSGEDLTFIWFKVTSSRVPLKDNLLAPVRFFRKANSETLIG